jgi:ATP-dependent Clp protease protease subunit
MADEGKSKLLMLNSNIHKDSAKTIIESILTINKEDDDKEKKEVGYKREPIKLILNSYGGSVYDGLGIVAVIDSSKTPVYTYVYGYAMSMGLLIAAAGHKRFGSKISTFMYHQISGHKDGKLEEITQSLEQSMKQEVVYDTYLLSKTNIRQTELDEVKKMKKDWFISADEALKLKVIDEII